MRERVCVERYMRTMGVGRHMVRGGKDEIGTGRYGQLEVQGLENVQLRTRGMRIGTWVCMRCWLEMVNMGR